MLASFESTAVDGYEQAILFLVFNRPDTTSQVFEAIRQLRPKRLYVAADGPRPSRLDEPEKCRQTRAVATAVDWPCEVQTLFREENLGCKEAVSSAITWFFDREEQGIILEDDCLPTPEFFGYCSELLNRYADDERVSAITGDNFQQGRRRGPASYYFSKYVHVWGWASWRRAWAHYDKDMRFWPEWRRSAGFRDRLPDADERRYWSEIFKRTYAGEIDTWDFSWVATVWARGGLVATPNVNLVSNIGFGAEATHTKDDAVGLSAIPTGTMGEISHPDSIVQDRNADRFVFENVMLRQLSVLQRSPLWSVYGFLKGLLRRTHA